MNTTSIVIACSAMHLHFPGVKVVHTSLRCYFLTAKCAENSLIGIINALLVSYFQNS